MADTHVGMQSGHDYRADSEFPQKDVEIRLEETAVSAFRNYIISFGQIQFRNDFRPFRPGNRMVAPYLQLAVNARNMGVIAEYDRHAGLARRIEKSGRSRNYGLGPVARKGACHEIIQHVYDKNSRFVQLFHNEIIFVKYRKYRWNNRRKSAD